MPAHSLATMQIAPKSATVDSLSTTAGRFVLPVEPWSVNILQLHIGASPNATVTGSSSLLAGGGGLFSRNNGGGGVASA